MDQLSDEVPLRDTGLKAAIICNLKRVSDSEIPDAEAEYDSPHTVEAIAGALGRNGISSVLIEADASLAEQLKEQKPDFAFNIAEGRGGRGREAQVPAVLDMLGIPYTGSDETTLGIALDKALTKRVLTTYRVRTPRSVVLRHGEPYRSPELHYPVIVKPNAEGSSKGIADVCVAANPAELKELVQRNLSLYREDMLCEEYIVGREFTVGILGNGADARVFPPMEIIFKRDTDKSYRVYSYNVKQEYESYIEYRCPADIPRELDDEMRKTALKVYNALGCLDFSRVDFRVSDDGKPYFIEINPLPGLAPGYSDFPMLAQFCGVEYDELIMSVVNAAFKRFEH